MSINEPEVGQLDFLIPLCDKVRIFLAINWIIDEDLPFHEKNLLIGSPLVGNYCPAH
jgi:hypothetical protein